MSSQKASAFSLSGGRTLANSGLKRNTEALLVRHGITSSLEHLNIIRVWYTYMYVVCNLKLKLTVASWRWLWIRMVRSLAEAPGCCWLAEADGPALRARCHWSTWGHMGTPGSLYKRESGPFQINPTSYTLVHVRVATGYPVTTNKLSSDIQQHRQPRLCLVTYPFRALP